MKSFFVTATDTDAGKTEVAALVLKALAMQGYASIAMKPIAAGCELQTISTETETSQKLRNSDALTLQKNATISLPYEEVNPFAYAPPIAPHVAAALCSDTPTPSVASLLQAYTKLTKLDADVLICEGAGGWQLPINESEYLADFVVAAQMPVILVVSMRLGCINHALLTAMAIRACGLPLAGWVANQVNPEQMPFYQENIASIAQRIGAPLLAEVPHFAGTHDQWLAAELAKPQNMLNILGL
ncbi:dethiobiotin synthase [Aliidiomarina sp.]|uniref:dethiobiotin synthase n=1 Tax=Aliidiomarina sp. TaxID=1872439 RepID=UPI003A4DF79B